MRLFKYLIGVVVLAAIALGVLMFGGTSSTAQTDQRDTIKYLPVPGGTYSIDPAHTVVGFSIRHLEINWVEGRFKDITGEINFNDKDVTKSSVTFIAKTASIDTGVEARNTHLRSADFFEVEKYPEMTFRSARVQKKGSGYVMSGDLTIKGVTKPISFPFTMTGAVKDPWGGTRFGVKAETTINRRDFGINYGNPMPSGGLDVGNEVHIDLNFEAVKAEPKAATVR